MKLTQEELIKSQGLTLDFEQVAQKAEMTKEEGLIAKWYGVYESREKGEHLIRILTPGGRITADQAKKIASLSERYANGLVSITTRQSFQLHQLKLQDIPHILQEIQGAGLTSFHGCGDVVRTMSTCPMAENCQYKRFDVRPLARETLDFLSSFRDLDNLPRKLKFTFSGCSAACAQPYMNCVGLIAVCARINGMEAEGFKVVIGGGMGWKGFVAQELFSFVPKDRVLELSRAISLLFRDYGDRTSRRTARLKFVVESLGIYRCREIILQNMIKEDKNIEGLEVYPVEQVGGLVPARPLTEQDPLGSDGKSVVRILIPKGETDAIKLEQIAELANIYGDDYIYTDQRQNIAIHGIKPLQVNSVKEQIHRIGFSTEGYFGLTDIVTCVGKSYCSKALVFTRELYDDLLPIVSAPRYKDICGRGIINLTGCQNSCSPYRISDIGFKGERIGTDSGSVDGYEILLAGDQFSHGISIGKYKKTDCLKIVETILDLFLEEGKADEYLKDFILRNGVSYFQSAVEAVL